MKTFIQAKLEDYNPGRVSQKVLKMRIVPLLEVKAHLCKFF